ncbi:TPA: hypothetical protein DCX15_02620 [bacterium]|nr:hypothetical protein [bacterium]
MDEIRVIYKKRRRLANKRLKILVLKPITEAFFGGPFMLSGAINAFRRLDHEVEVIPLEKYAVDQKRLNQLIWEVANSSPDFVFTLNFIGLFPIMVETMEKMELPHVSWFVDSPLAYLKEKEFISSYTVVFVCDRMYIRELNEFGFKHVYYLPGATDPKIFHRIREDIKDFRCNISFVGSSHARSLQAYRQMIGDGNAQRVLPQAIRLQIENPTLSMSDILEEIQKLLPPTVFLKDPEGEIRALLEQAAMAIYRKEIIEGVAEFGLHLYGDEGWRILLDEKVKIFNTLDYYTDLPKLYNASKISLNITLCGLKTTVNQRVFDVSACASFILTDYRKDLSGLFELGRDLICYRDSEELRALVRYYLKHPKERKEIAKRAQNLVLKEHTYVHRMDRLIRTLREIYGT